MGRRVPLMDFGWSKSKTIGGWRQWRLEDFYHLKLASRLEMITVGEATICVPVKLGLGQFLPKDKRGIDRFVSVKKRRGLAMWFSFYWVRGERFQEWHLRHSEEILTFRGKMSRHISGDCFYDTWGGVRHTQRRCGLLEEMCLMWNTKGCIKHTPCRCKIMEKLCLIV